MKKRLVIFILMSIVILQILLTENILASSKYYSYKDIGIDYTRGVLGTYGTGKNGYSFIRIYKVSNNKIVYRHTKMILSKGWDGLAFKEYGKKMTAKLTEKTKYYIGDIQKINRLRLSAVEKNPNKDITIHSKFYKTRKWIAKTTKSYFSKKYSKHFSFIKIKNNTAVNIVSNLQTDG